MKFSNNVYACVPCQIHFPMLHSNHKVIGSDPVYALPDYSLHGIMQALVVLDFETD